MNYPALIFWALVAWSVTASRGTVLILLLASMPFASLALLPPSVAFGMSILPQSMFAVVLILKGLAPQIVQLSPKLLAACRFQNLGFLIVFLLVGIVAAMIMPSFFAGEVVIVPMREEFGADVLNPSQANFTQSAYLTLSVMIALAVALMADEPRFEETLLISVLAAGTVCVVTGLIDLSAASAGMESWLEPFRNARYALLTNADMGGVRRVVGLAPEASTYGGLCVQFAAAVALFRGLYAKGHQRLFATMVTVGLTVMAVLSTSSTAYGGLAILGLAYAINWVRRAASSSALGRSGLLGEFLVGLGAAIALLSILILRGNLFDPLLNLVDEVIFNKPLTTSFYGRSEWNSIAWNAVASTWGLGVGLGSTRASNWFAAVISNTGVTGAALMCLFLIQTFARRAIWQRPLSDELLPALKLSLLPVLVMAGVAAPGPDFGSWMAVVFGAIAGIAAVRPEDGSWTCDRRKAYAGTFS
jgi:hypothetical protein